jgi:serine/threonine protein kinase
MIDGNPWIAYDDEQAPISHGMGGPTFRGWFCYFTKPSAGSPSELVSIPAAIKQIRADDGKGYRSEEEYRLLSTIRHPNVVKLLGRVVDEQRTVQTGRVALATEFIPGRVLDEQIREAIQAGMTDTSVWHRRVFHWAVKLAGALTQVNLRGIIHRDISPSNVIIREGDDEPILIDFGLARMTFHSTTASRTRTPLGGQYKTEMFASPEQFCPGKRECPICSGQDEECRVGLPSDIYSFGTLLWYMFSGEYPFSLEADPFTAKRRGSADTSALPAIPKLRELLGRMLSVTPEERPIAIQVMETLEDIAYDEFQIPGQGRDATEIDSRLHVLEPPYADLRDKVRMATTLVSSQYWACIMPSASPRSFFADDQTPVRVSYDLALEFLKCLNLKMTGQFRRWRLPTLDEWRHAAGFPVSTSLPHTGRPGSSLLTDASSVEWEWCTANGEGNAVQTLCYLSNGYPATGERHRRIPKGAIRLVMDIVDAPAVANEVPAVPVESRVESCLPTIPRSLLNTSRHARGRSTIP